MLYRVRGHLSNLVAALRNDHYRMAAITNSISAFRGQYLHIRFDQRMINMKFLAFWPRLAAIIICSGMLAACETISTGSHYDETTNFGAYQTFSWIDEVPYISYDSDDQVSPLTQSKIMQAIQAQLQQKGYSFVEDRGNADFVVAFTIGTRDEIRISSYPAGYRGSWGWHVHGSYYYVREYTEHSYTKGSLGVDIFDGKSKKPVWHGWAEKTISDSDRKNPDPVIQEGVAKLFESFPR